MDCSPLHSSGHGICQVRILEWVAISSFRGSSRPRDQTCISCMRQAGSLLLSPSTSHTFAQLGFSGGASGKEPGCQCRRCRFNPWVGKIPWRRAQQPIQYSFLENPMDRGAWRATVHEVTESWTQLCN